MSKENEQFRKLAEAVANSKSGPWSKKKVDKFLKKLKKDGKRDKRDFVQKIIDLEW